MAQSVVTVALDSHDIRLIISHPKAFNSFTANSQYYIGEVEWSRFTDSQFIGEVSKLVSPVKSLCVS